MTGGLFDSPDEAQPAAPAPLADRMRPRSFDEVTGQRALLAPDAPLRRAIEQDGITSLVLWGPPGTGKTTIARLLAAKVDADFVAFSAVLSGVKELRVVCKSAEAARARGRRTLLFVDEIHRFNRAQQDAFLPYVERGDVILVGATTENPSFELNAALQSRLLVYTLERLTEADVVDLCSRALTDDRGLASASLGADENALRAIARFAAGDARRALNALETIASSARPGSTLTHDDVESALGHPLPVHDKAGEEHFNLLSAFHKSLRNSDADAALYYMVRMLDGGEDPLVIVRRMCAFAAEDVGTSDPQALQVALAALESVRFLGLPEGRLAMGNACVYLAVAPRSNAVYRALNAAQQAVRDHPRATVPMHLRNAPTGLMKNLGYGKGYVYAHDTDDGVADMTCLPDELADRCFYRPSDRGFEKRIQARLDEIAEGRKRASAADDVPD